MVVVAYRDGQAEPVEPDFQAAGRPGVRESVPDQLARHQHRVVTHLLETPVPADLVDEQACPTRRRHVVVQIKAPDLDHEAGSARRLVMPASMLGEQVAGLTRDTQKRRSQRLHASDCAPRAGCRHHP